MKLSLRELPRLEVDPNSFASDDPTVSVVLRRHAPRGVRVGDLVAAIQPDEDGSCGYAEGVVTRMTDRLVYVRVAWEKFFVEPARPLSIVVTGTNVRATDELVVTKPFRYMEAPSARTTAAPLIPGVHLRRTA